MATLIVPKSVVGGIPINVTDLLKTAHRIPAYQRDYVWQEKTVQQMWTDLIDHFRANSQVEMLPDPEGYFLGAMVVIEHADDEPLEIVDGQQRLTTLNTIVSVLYDAVQKLDDKNPSKMGLQARLLEMLAKYDGDKWVSNLSFSDKDLQEFFAKSCIEKRSLSEKQDYWDGPWAKERLSRKRSPLTRIRAAIEGGYGALNSFLDEINDLDLRETRLVSFIRLVTEVVVILRITAKSYSNAYSIFESLNNRGVPLSQADLIKSELLKAATESDREEVIENWARARQTADTFEVVQLPDLIHYSYLSRHGRVKAKDLYSAVKSIIVKAPENAKRYSEDLVEDAEALDALSENFSSGWSSDTNNMLKDLKTVLGVKLCYPFLLAAYRKYAKSPGEFELYVRAILNFVFRYMKVLEGSQDALAGIVSDAALGVNSGWSPAEICSDLKKHATDEKFVEEFRTVAFSNVKLAYFSVYYLEKVRLAGSVPMNHGEDQNLEHIMPKSPKASEWPKAIGAKTANPDMFKDYLWRVGNLLPLPAAINKSLKNRGIAHKISNSTSNNYNSTNLVSPKEVSKFLSGNEWDFKSIEDRQNFLATEHAIKAWKL